MDEFDSLSPSRSEQRVFWCVDCKQAATTGCLLEHITVDISQQIKTTVEKELYTPNECKLNLTKAKDERVRYREILLTIRNAITCVQQIVESSLERNEEECKVIDGLLGDINNFRRNSYEEAVQFFNRLMQRSTAILTHSLQATDSLMSLQHLDLLVNITTKTGASSHLNGTINFLADPYFDNNLTPEKARCLVAFISNHFLHSDRPRTFQPETSRDSAMLGSIPSTVSSTTTTERHISPFHRDLGASAAVNNNPIAQKPVVESSSESSYELPQLLVRPFMTVVAPTVSLTNSTNVHGDAQTREDVYVNVSPTTSPTKSSWGVGMSPMDSFSCCSWRPNSDTLAFISSGICNLEMADSKTIVLQHHDDPAVCLTWSKDGKNLATGSQNGCIRFWSVGENGTTENSRISIKGHGGRVTALKFNPSGKCVASGGFDKIVFIWDVISGSMIRKFNFHVDKISDIDWKDERIFASCSADGCIYVIEKESQTYLHSLASQAKLSTIHWSYDGTYLAFFTSTLIKIWEPACDKVEELTGHTKSVNGISWIPNEKTLVSCSTDGSCIVWDVSKQKKVNTLMSKNKEKKNCLAVSYSGKLLAVGGINGALELWNIKKATSIDSGKSEKYGIHQVEWNYNDSLLALATNYTVKKCSTNKTNEIKLSKSFLNMLKS